MMSTLAQRDAEPAALPFVEGALNYIALSSDRAFTLAYEPEPGQRRTNIVNETHLVPIHDLRPIAETAALDAEGFSLVRAASAVRDFYDEDELRRVYYPEAERIVAAATGGARVFVFDHTVRRRVWGVPDRAAGLPRQPIGRVHVDHTARSGPQRVRDFLGAEADDLLKGRLQIVNLWRPIRGPLRDAPLAVCDASSVAPDDLVLTDLVYRDRAGEIYSARHSPAHRWYYVPGMRTDEALLLKCYDSDTTPGMARFMPHTAFDDPTAPAAMLPRESIELRTMVFHPA
jgi:hypothetical protein